MGNSTLRSETRGLVNDVKDKAKIIFGLLAIMWALEIVDSLFLGQRLNLLGIRPRSISGLFGIFFSPFLHAGFFHLIANTFPFIFLGWLVIIDKKRDFFLVSLIVMFVSGFGTWLIGQKYSVHIGASGVIFGYFGFLLMRGYYQKSAPWILVSIFVGLIYGWMIFGVLPGQCGISWQGHLFGFIGGVLAARLYRAPIRGRRISFR